MNQTIAVYCSSSDALSEEYISVAKDVGKYIGENQNTLVWGGANVGLMGIVAAYTQKYHGRVIAVFPKTIKAERIIYKHADELIMTEDLQERKKIMAQKADAFIVLPGGFGTIEEAAEVLTMKQLQIHTKAFIFINTRNFFDGLIQLFETMYREHIAKPDYRAIYYVAKDAADAFAYLKAYIPPHIPQKWIEKKQELEA